MSNAYTGAAASKLRTLVEAIEQDIAQTPPTATLRAAWGQLVETLALGPEPQTRECPVCHSIGMRAASRCGTCWSALEPLPPLPEETRGHA
ncbi:MAG: hypothetical protein AB7T06_27310 [Kofleriaceae bacterium]